MLSTVYKFFEDIAPDICSFAIAVVGFKILYWYTNRTQANLSRPLAKKVVSNFSASSASDTDRSGYAAGKRAQIADRNRSVRTTDRVAWKPSTSPVGAPPQDPQQVYQSVTRIKEVLEGWGTKQDDAMSHLQDAIAGLAPHDAAIVKALLDSKAAEHAGRCQQGRENARAARERHIAQHWDHSSIAARSEHQQRCQQGRENARGSEHQQRLKEFEDSGDSLRANLLELASLDPDTVIMVRKISHIGLDAAEVLKAYFSKFGTIDRVMVSHCIARSASGNKRLRPAALGFLVMSKAEEAQAAIAEGEVQRVQGFNITVGAFASHPVS